MMIENVKFNPIEHNYRNEIGGALQNAPQFFCIKLAKTLKATMVHLEYSRENLPKFGLFMEKVSETDDYDVFGVQTTFVYAELHWYKFSFMSNDVKHFVNKGKFGKPYTSQEEDYSWQLTVYEKGDTPEWFKGGTMYQIFPDRFNRSGEIVVREGGLYHENWLDTPEYLPVDGYVLNNDFFGGNFQGVIEKLDYIESLGVTILYFNPIFEADSNHKYDTSDFSKIDPCFGGEEEFKNLIKECNKRGMKIILDGVFNHVGENSKYFNKGNKYNEIGAYQSKNSQYYDWFKFINYPTKYDSWWGIELLPAINGDSYSYVDYICGENGIADKYLKMGIGGFRLDVVDELNDYFLNKLTERIKETNYDAVIIGEVWEDASNKVAYGKRRYYFTKNQLDGVMNYPWKNSIINFIRSSNSEGLQGEIFEVINNYPKKNLHSLMNILGTHDTERIITTLAGRERGRSSKEELAKLSLTDDEKKYGKRLVMLASLLQYTLPGVPSIYYGDETALEGYQDPLNRRTYPWGKEDCELINWFKILGEIRREECFISGDLILTEHQNGIISFKRISENSEILVVVNMNDHSINLDGEYFDLLTMEKVDSVGGKWACICKIK